jgi:hypothetical protein
MNIWTAFFLVVSAVILASPLLSSRDAVRSGSDNGSGDDSRSAFEDNELELDLASGRLAPEDYEAMTGRKMKPISQPAENAEGDDGSLPEG